MQGRVRAHETQGGAVGRATQRVEAIRHRIAAQMRCIKRQRAQVAAQATIAVVECGIACEGADCRRAEVLALLAAANRLPVRLHQRGSVARLFLSDISSSSLPKQRWKY